MRLLAFGGRFYDRRDVVYRVLDSIHAKYPVTLLIQGEASGADSLAREWAMSRKVPWKEGSYPARWAEYGKSAGSKRNSQMLVEGKPDMAVGFPGTSGSADMERKCHSAKVPCYRITQSGEWIPQPANATAYRPTLAAGKE